MARGGQWGIAGGIAGRSSMDRLRPGERGGCAFCLCHHWNGAERPEEQIVLKWEQMHWAVRGRAMTRHRGARHTPSPLLYPSPRLRGPPSFPSRGSLETREYFSPYGNVPEELLLVQIPAGLGAAWAVVEGREALAAVSYSPGEAEIMGISPPNSAISGKSLPGFKDLAPVVKPFGGCGTSCTGLVVMKSSTCCRYREELHKELQHLTLYRASLHLFQQAPESSMVHFPDAAG